MMLIKFLFQIMFLQLLFVSFLLWPIHCSISFNASDPIRKHYIVYMGSHSFPNNTTEVASANTKLLSSFTDSHEEAENSITYHYHKTFRGFSAMLTPHQRQRLAENNTVISVIEDQTGQLHTIRSWDFMGAFMQSKFGIESRKDDLDVIVGHFDSGIWPEAPSFQGYESGEVPQRWKGRCSSYELCPNTKVIGSRFYHRGFEQQFGPIENNGELYYLSARDDFGHGTHTASTAVGLPIDNVNFRGRGGNVVRGGAPGARLAVYKVCWFNKCTCSDVLKAFDDAIYDGVDIITMSAGAFISRNKPDFLHDCFAIGALHAFQNGILVSTSAGNNGKAETVDNAAPWMLTVGAGSDDRVFGPFNYRRLPAPQVADFSSKGPGSALDIIKPDIIAPGVDILAAWPAWDEPNPSFPIFKVDSGTSMACPHATGVAATIKGLFSGFSPAALKSALMTTALNLDPKGGRIKSGRRTATPFDMGSGHLNPNKAINPGLVYDFDMKDIVSYLCNIVDSRKIEAMTGARVSCPSPAVPAYNLNYPSIAVSNLRKPVTVTRTVTYVGREDDPNVFRVRIEKPPGVSVEIEPRVLDFSDWRTRTRSYTVRLTPERGLSLGRGSFGSITWFNDMHSVRSPIAVGGQ